MNERSDEISQTTRACSCIVSGTRIFLLRMGAGDGASLRLFRIGERVRRKVQVFSNVVQPCASGQPSALGIQPARMLKRCCIATGFRMGFASALTPKLIALFCFAAGFRFSGIVRQQSPTPSFPTSMNHFEANSAEAFVQHLAIRLIGNGYIYFVLCEIPQGKDPVKVDEKLVQRYGVRDNKWRLFRRAERGEAKVRYLRFQKTFLLVATPGRHLFFSEEGAAVRDARNDPIRCFGYSIKAKKRVDGGYLPRVRLSLQKLSAIRAGLFALQTASEDEIEDFINEQHLLWFSGVKRQVFRLFSQLNAARKAAGLDPVFVSREAFRNRTLSVFERHAHSKRSS